MVKQLYFEEVDVGMSIPELVKDTNPRQLVEYAGAARDFHPFHYDDSVARSAGFPGVISHGGLKTAFLCQMLTDWMGEAGIIKKAAVQYRAGAAGLQACGHVRTLRPAAVHATCRTQPRASPSRRMVARPGECGCSLCSSVWSFVPPWVWCIKCIVSK